MVLCNQSEYIARMQAVFENLKKANMPERGIITKVLMPNENQNNPKNPDYLRTYESSQLEIDHNGIKGDRHYGVPTREVGRNPGLLQNGAYFNGTRHLMAISPYDCKVLSDRLGNKVTPENTGTNIVIEREDGADYSLSALPSEAYIIIAPENSEVKPENPLAILVRQSLQQGCKVAGRCIAEEHGDKNLINKFKEESTTNRGIVCRVIYPFSEYGSAIIKPGQKVFFGYEDGVCK